MNINSVLENIKAELKAHFPDLRDCDIHGGRFDQEALKNISTRAPAMFVSLLGLPKFKHIATEERETTLTLAIYVITKNTSKQTKDSAAIHLVESLSALIATSRWNKNDLGEAQFIRAENLFSAGLKFNSIALWGVTWQQNIILGENVWNTNEFLPSELYASSEGDQIGSSEEEHLNAAI